MLSLGLFLPMAVTALVLSWHNRDVRNIAFALLLSWAVSNAVSIWLPFNYRPLIYPVLEVIVGLLAAGAGLVMRYTPEELRPHGSKLFAMLIVATALVSVAACVNYALLTSPGYSDKYFFVLWTNICFSVECIVVGTWGIRDAFARAAGVARVFRSSWVAPQPIGPVEAVEGEE